MNRRSFLAGVTALAASNPLPVIDAHIHLFDPTRPQGVPWPDKGNRILYRPALPGRYRRIAATLGSVGAIAVECSPWPEDNQWVLDTAAKDTIIVGTVGNLEPGKKNFRKSLERFHRNRLFLGIRYGNLWGRDLGAELSKTDFVSDLKFLAREGLELDTANPTPALLLDIARLADRVPELRIVVDHLPRHVLPIEPAEIEKRRTALVELGKYPQVYLKVSQVLRRVAGQISFDAGLYRPALDELWEIFGQDRLLYGSDWPNSDPWGPYLEALRVVREYFTGKGSGAAEKFFWRNSAAAYRWVRRDSSQPGYRVVGTVV